MKKYLERYKSKKRSKYLRFMQTFTDVGMYAAAAWFITLFLCIVAPNYPAIKYSFVIISGLWISSFIFFLKTQLSKFTVSLIKSPKYIFVGQENEIEIKVNILKGNKKDWRLRIVTNNHPNEKKDYLYYLWLYKPNMKKWLNRWAVQNNIGFYEEELSSIATSDVIVEDNEVIKIKIFGRKRGVGIISQIKLGRTDPLGWLQSNKFIDIPNKKVFVLPKSKKITSWPSSRAKTILLQQKEKSQRKITQNGDEWANLREARYNDPMKNTHWKSLAKTGKRWIIEKEEIYQSKLALVVDPVLYNSEDNESFELLMETVSGQVMNTGTTNDINWIFIDSDPISANGHHHNAWDRVMEKVSVMNPISEEETDKAWTKFIPYWKNIVALRVLTTRTEDQLKKWIVMWKKMGIDVEIINVINKEEHERK